jgi:hypothetical protein
MIEKRRNTAALMKSFCLYTHEQMRQMEIKKHLSKTLNSNKTTITPSHHQHQHHKYQSQRVSPQLPTPAP